MSLNTELTRRLGLRVPVIAAPLGYGSTPPFVGTLTRHGSLGFVGLSHVHEEDIRATLSEYISACGGADRFGINLTLISDQANRLDAALDMGCKVLSLWQGDIAPYVRRAKNSGATVFWTVAGPEDAAQAADLGVDFIVCQGREAGGHVIGEAPIMALLPAVVDAAGSVPVVAAGGISDGRGLAAALCLGACGVWLGTRFVASSESGNHSGHKHLITKSAFTDLVETTLFDGNWPDSPHQVLRSPTLTAWQAAGSPAPGVRPGEGDEIGHHPDGSPMLRYDVAEPWEGMDGDWSAAALYAGASTALVRAVEKVDTILWKIEDEARASLLRATAYQA